MSFLSSLTSLVKFSNEEKLPLLKTIGKLKQSKTVQQANFIHSAIYSFSFTVSMSSSQTRFSKYSMSSSPYFVDAKLIQIEKT